MAVWSIDDDDDDEGVVVGVVVGIAKMHWKRRIMMIVTIARPNGLE